MVNDLNSILKKFLASLSKNEANVAELTKGLKSWVIENSELVKEKVETQIDETAIRMGFVKADELDLLNQRIAELEKRSGKDSGETESVSKKSAVKKSAVKKSAVKKSAVKKSAVKKSAVKKSGN
jgi:hypothetical protein